MPFHDPGKPLHECHDEDLELLVEADRLGFDEFHVSVSEFGEFGEFHVSAFWTFLGGDTHLE